MSFSSKCYKGTRDFYPDFTTNFTQKPENTAKLLDRQYIFDTWRQTLTKFGFQEYDTPIIEQAQMYLAKSGQELGSKELYNFKDKKGREIALRPEMTPSLSRIIAEKYQQLKFPLRWFSIPNCFRYERPQRGRLREFWQLNADILGLEEGEADLEFLFLTQNLMLSFGATKDMFSIKVNHRQLLDLWLKQHHLDTQKQQIYSFLDDFAKINRKEKPDTLKQVFAEATDKYQKVFDLASKTPQAIESYLKTAQKLPKFKLILDQITSQQGKDTFLTQKADIVLDPTIVRGLDYYTGLVFECFDNNPRNPRSIFGGGRYDNLMELFEKPKTPAIGLGLGDVIMLDFLEDWGLLQNQKYQNWLQKHQPQKVGILLKSQEVDGHKATNFSQIFEQVIPRLLIENKTWEIDYQVDRSLKKRIETLKKKGCTEII